MKTKILLITIITIMSLSLKSQSLQLLNDTNIIYYDYDPDVVLYGSIVTGVHDSLKIDINQDGLLDFKFFFRNVSTTFMPSVMALTSNCKFRKFPISSADSLNNPTITWFSGDDYWTDVSDVYFGIKIISDTNNYYGWIHAIHGVIVSTARTITVDKYAFCKIPNYPFYLGQTEITNVPVQTTTGKSNVYIGDSGNSIVVNSGKQIKKITLTNVSGAVVSLKENVNSNNANINTAGFAHGSYFIKVQFTDNTSYTKQIVL